VAFETAQGKKAKHYPTSVSNYDVVTIPSIQASRTRTYHCYRTRTHQEMR